MISNSPVSNARSEKKASLVSRVRGGMLWRMHDLIVTLSFLVVLYLGLQGFATGFVYSLGAFALIQAAAAITLLPIARTGEISFAPAALMGLGAYIAAGLTVTHGVSMLLAIVIAALMGSLFGALLGLMLARLTHFYLALATLIVVMLFRVAVLNSESLRGVSGFVGVPPLEIGGVSSHDGPGFILLASGAVLLLALVVRPFIAGPRGWALDGIAQSAVLIDALGYSRPRVVVWLFAVSGLGAGLAGGLYAAYVGFVNPGPFELLAAVGILLAVYIGGTRAIYGPLFGAGVHAGLTEGSSEFLLQARTELSGGFVELGLAGVLLVLAIVAFPLGLTGIPPLRQLIRRQGDQYAGRASRS